ncbi:MAG TPA: DUF302 domain-containing protein [Acidiferrobacterales bacterium]|nr:DUF302 domain-containing protein [Acidiferrobacterales bacterium]
MSRFRLLALFVWLGLNHAAAAEELLMARITRPFPEAMNHLQETIRAKGYVVSRVQRVDVGLTASGFPTAEYRIVFFGKQAEIRELSAAYPELIPYLPLTIVVFAEGDDTLVLTTDPLKLGEFFNKPELLARFGIWEKDVRAIFDAVARNP